VSGNGRITLDNTLEERLRLLEDKVRRPIALHS
jgi:vacuolar-type H+-ATPase subunit E/Vma4